MDCDFINETFKSFFNISDFTAFSDIKTRMPEEQMKVVFATIHKNFVEKKKFSLEIMAFNESNALKYLLLIGTPMLDKNGKMLGMLCVLLDINDEKTSELLYRESQSKYYSLFQNMDSSVIYFDIINDEQGNAYDAEITECNDMTYQIFNVQKPDIRKMRLRDVKF